MLLNYNHLYYFHVAAVEGSVAAAAQRLGVRQPTVSEQLRALEGALGTELFERVQTGLRMTEAGRLAFLQTSRIFSVGERLAEVIGHGLSAGSRILRIGVSSTIARSTKNDFLLPLLALRDFIFTTRTADDVDLLRSLRTGNLDLVLCEIEPSIDMRRGRELQTIDRTKLLAVAPVDLEVATDWTEAGLAHFRPTSPYWWAIAAHLEARGLRPRVIAEAEDALFLVDAALHCRCVAIVPESAARHALEAGRLRILEEVKSPGLGVQALYHDNTMAKRAIELLAGIQAR
jgi:LysR family transcriptional activator of nhaA